MHPIREMLLSGKKYNEICNTLNVTKSTVAYHARQLGLVRGRPIVKKLYDWNEVQRIYDTGLCLTELSLTTKIPRATITNAIKAGKLVIDRMRVCQKPDGKKIPLSEIFKSNSDYDSAVVKRRVLSDNLLHYSCSNPQCTLHGIIPEWNGASLVLHLDHINGIRNDHRLVNLRWLCPNCHSQTDTYCGRNKKNGGPTANRTPDADI